MNTQLIGSVALCVAAFSACGGGSDSTPSAAPTTLSAGQSITLEKGQTVDVPAGTTVSAPNGNVVVVQGHSNTVTTSPGSVVSVATSASGPADNIVVAQ
jgi:hypothetical protein